MNKIIRVCLVFVSTTLLVHFDTHAASPGRLHRAESHTAEILTFANFEEHLTEYYQPQLKDFILEASANDLVLALIEAFNADHIETPATRESMSRNIITIICALKLIKTEIATQFKEVFYHDKNLTTLISNLKATYESTFSSLISTEGEKARMHGLHEDPIQQLQYLCLHIKRFTPISYIAICNALTLSQNPSQAQQIFADAILKNALEPLRQERATIASTLAKRILLLCVASAAVTLASNLLF